MIKTMFIAFCLTVSCNIWTAEGFYLHNSARGHCGRGMTMIGQFFNCTKPLMLPYRIDSNWQQAGYTMNQGILSHLETYCGMVLARGEQCLENQIAYCDANIKKFVMNDVKGAGGFCDGASVTADVRNLLNALPKASPLEIESCPKVDTRTCYRALSTQLYTEDVYYLPYPELAPFVKSTFESIFRCLVNKFRAQPAGQCPSWQLNLLWRHTSSFLPHPIGFSLNPYLLRSLYP